MAVKRDPCIVILCALAWFAVCGVAVQVGSLALYGFATRLSPWYMAIMVCTAAAFVIAWRLSVTRPRRALTWGAWAGLVCVGGMSLLYACETGEAARILKLLPVGVILHSFYVRRRRPAIVYAVAVGVASLVFAFTCAPQSIQAIQDAVSRTIVSAFGVAISARRGG